MRTFANLMIPAFDPHSFSDLKELLGHPAKVMITTHHKPDGDAMGSSLALFLFLKSLGHEVTVVSPSDYPDFLSWLPGQESVINFERNQRASIEKVKQAAIIFCLDFNAVSRMEKLGEHVSSSSAKKVLIDHHLDPEPFCDYTFSFPESCATCELVYYFIREANGTGAITSDIATCLYTGIMTDTGSFRFSSMSADTHNVIAELIRCGASNYRIHESIYDNFSIERTRFLGHCIKEKLTVLPEYKTAYIAVGKDELKTYNHRTGDTEGIVNYALGIKGIRLAAFFCERDNIIKISFRSKDDFSVKDLAGTHFSGGGHKNAAGGRSYLSLEQTVQKFLDLLPGLKSTLNSN